MSHPVMRECKIGVSIKLMQQLFSILLLLENQNFFLLQCLGFGATVGVLEMMMLSLNLS